MMNKSYAVGATQTILEKLSPMIDSQTKEAIEITIALAREALRISEALEAINKIY